MKILIFENSRQIAERLIELIGETKKNLTFYKACSYGEALYFLNECTPDAVLLDFEYPDNSSIELLKRIKASNNKPIILALLSEMNESSVKQCERYGADFIFDKYADFEQIPAAVNAIMVSDDN
ncbi:MAG: response regulator [Ginsengibacter sp.]